MNTELEKIILTLTVNDTHFAAKVNPHFKPEYFSNPETTTVAKLYQDFFQKYNALPTSESLKIELENMSSISQETFSNTKILIDDLYESKKVSALSKIEPEFILKKTENYFKQQACHYAILESLAIIEGENKKLKTEAIPDILKNAISISFDTDIGHDYIDNALDRFDSYHKVEVKVPFPLNGLNLITGGGAVKKSLITPVAPTGVGKSFFMTAWAADLIRNMYDVLYITLEMPEEQIAQRVDMNLFNFTKNEVTNSPKSTFISNIQTLKKKGIGKLKIKEYVTGTFDANHLRSLLKELKQKENFQPHVIMIDYLSLMASYRSTNVSDTYGYNKAIAEEIRGVAMEFNLIVVAPMQTNRTAINQADFTLSEIAESAGVAHTADFMFGLIQTEEMGKVNQMRIKQLKNRWGDVTRPSSFMINVDKSKMQLFDGDDLTKYFSTKQIQTSTTNNALPQNQQENKRKNQLSFE